MGIRRFGIRLVLACAVLAMALALLTAAAALAESLGVSTSVAPTWSPVASPVIVPVGAHASGVRPAIVRLSISAAKPGSRLTISGRGFGARRGKGSVIFGAFKGTSYLRWSATRIVCKVPVIPAGKVLLTVRTAKRTSKGKRFAVKALPTVVPDTTEVLSAATVAGATTTDGLTYAFANTSQTSRLKRGDVIVGKPTAALPEGIFRKVTAVAAGGRSVTTKPATLDEVFASAQFSADHALTQSDATSAAITPGVRLVRSRAQRPDLLTFRFVDVGISSSLSADFGPVSMSGTITLKTTVHVGGAIDWGGVKSFETSETTTVSSDLHASASLSAFASLEKEWEIAKIPGFTVMVGPVPLYFQPKLAIVVGVTGDISRGTTISVHEAITGGIGLTYQSGKFTSWTQFSTDSSYQPPTLTTTCSLKAYAGAKLGLKLYDLAGPYIKLDGYAKLTADVNKSPWWKFSAGIEAAMGLEIGGNYGFIKWGLDWHTDPFIIKEWPLAQAKTPPPTPSPTPTDTGTPTPTPTPTPGNGAWANVFGPSLALKRDGTLWGWGPNGGALGLGDFDQRLTPAQVGTATDWTVASIAGADHSLAIKKDGTLWVWGQNNVGQLGLGDTEPRWVPTELGTATDWAAVSASHMYSLAIKKDGTLWAWGYNYRGDLGLGDTTDRSVPTQVGSGRDWAVVSTSFDFALALKKDGTLWAWGYNSVGQLGVGDGANRLTPTRVGSADDWAAVSAAFNDHAFAVKSNGTLWAWGYNDDGALGLGDASNRYAPTQVGTDGDWAAVSAGSRHALALKRDGTLWAWGFNDHGQLGLGDTTNRPTPVQVGGATDWASVFGMESDSTLALKQDGTLWAWGYNSSGSLGLGDTNDRYVPTEVTSGSP